MFSVKSLHMCENGIEPITWFIIYIWSTVFRLNFLHSVKQCFFITGVPLLLIFISQSDNKFSSSVIKTVLDPGQIFTGWRLIFKLIRVVCGMPYVIATFFVLIPFEMLLSAFMTCSVLHCFFFLKLFLVPLTGIG